VICFFCLIGDVLASAFIAYAFSCIRFRRRDAIFLLVLATMMVPGEIRLIPQFILFKSLGWINTFLPLIVPTYFGSPYLIFLFRQSFRNIPRELLEVARLDGCSHFGIWWRIVLPLSKPALATVAIFSFMFHWNDFTAPLVYLNSNDLYPISLGLSQYTAAYGGTAWNMLMAASLVAVLPCIVVFFLAQRYIVQSVAISGPGSAGK
jgi:multiple sugar transport system permease protein